MSAKREAAALPPAEQQQLATVARALDHAARIGSTFAVARTTRDTEKIKARGVVTQRHKGEPAACEVAGDAFESQNPSWREFLDEKFVNVQRQPLGIASTATVEVKLRKLMLAEQGARLLEPPQAEGRCEGAFGTLVVVLPGSFTGGDVVVEDYRPLHDDYDWENDYDDEEVYDDERDISAAFWRRGDQGETFHLVCAAFHDCCDFKAEPIESGAAFCLVYDLVTTTAPCQIRLYGGREAVQHSVNTALYEYFHVAPPQLAKRFKISPDAWRTIHEFAAERSFVYLVDNDKAEDLGGPEYRIAKSLAAFCAQSRGEYVLYFSSVLCSRLDKIDSSSDEDDDSSTEVAASSNDRLAEPRVTLIAPWVKYSEPEVELSCPSIFLEDHRSEVAPIGRVDELRVDYLDRSWVKDVHKDVLQTLYGNQRHKMACAAHALVVLPASVERRQIAMLPMETAIARVRALLAKSRDEGLEYARRVVHYCPGLSDAFMDRQEEFETFARLAVEFDDRRLFEELLLKLDLQFVDDEGVLWEVIKHFGFDECVGAVERRVRSTLTVRGRVNLVLAALDESLASSRIEGLLDVLLSLHPWTNVRVDASQGTTTKADEMSSSNATRRLFKYALQISPEKVIQVASVKAPEALVRMILPALTELVNEGDPDALQLRDAFVDAYKSLKLMMPEIRNELFAKFQLPKDCVKYEELQSFLTSTAIATTVECANEEEVQRVRELLWRTSGHSIEVHDAGGRALHLVKEVQERYSFSKPKTLYAPARKACEKARKALALPEESGDAQVTQ